MELNDWLTLHVPVQLCNKLRRIHMASVVHCLLYSSSHCTHSVLSSTTGRVNYTCLEVNTEVFLLSGRTQQCQIFKCLSVNHLSEKTANPSAAVLVDAENSPSFRHCLTVECQNQGTFFLNPFFILLYFYIQSYLTASSPSYISTKATQSFESIQDWWTLTSFIVPTPSL